MKKSAMHGLKSYGNGLERIEGVCSQIVGDLCTSVSDMEGCPFDINPLLHDAVADIVTTLVKNEIA